MTFDFKSLRNWPNRDTDWLNSRSFDGRCRVSCPRIILRVKRVWITEVQGIVTETLRRKRFRGRGLQRVRRISNISWGHPVYPLRTTPSLFGQTRVEHTNPLVDTLLPHQVSSGRLGWSIQIPWSTSCVGEFKKALTVFFSPSMIRKTSMNVLTLFPCTFALLLM